MLQLSYMMPKADIANQSWLFRQLSLKSLHCSLLSSHSSRQPLLINQEWHIQWNPFVLLTQYLLKLLKGWDVYLVLLYLSPVPQGRSNAETFPVQWGNKLFHDRLCLSPSVCPQGSTYWASGKGAKSSEGGRRERRKQLQLIVPFPFFFLFPSCKKEKRTIRASQKLINALDLLKEN